MVPGASFSVGSLRCDSWGTLSSISKTFCHFIWIYVTQKMAACVHAPFWSHSLRWMQLWSQWYHILPPRVRCAPVHGHYLYTVEGEPPEILFKRDQYEDGSTTVVTLVQARGQGVVHVRTTRTQMRTGTVTKIMCGTYMNRVHIEVRSPRHVMNIWHLPGRGSLLPLCDETVAMFSKYVASE